jgi:hypothetical protein
MGHNILIGDINFTPCIIGDESDEPEDGWDTATVVIKVYATSRAGAKTAALGVSVSYGAGTMIQCGVNPRLVGPVLWSTSYKEYHVTRRFKGMISASKPVKWHFTSQGTRRTVEHSTIPGHTDVTVNVAESQSIAIARYITTIAPDMSDVGTQVDPAHDLGGSTNPWTVVDPALYAYPHGWTLEGRDADETDGVIWLVEDRFVDYPEITQGG